MIFQDSIKVLTGQIFDICSVSHDLQTLASEFWLLRGFDR